MTQPITVEAYLESMRQWISVSISRSVRPESALFNREDLMQDAREALLEVVRDYPEKLVAGKLDELQKIGRRAIFNHTGNLYYKERALKRGRGVSRVRVRPGDSAQSDDLSRETVYEAHLRDLAPHCDVALERLIVREEVDRVAAAFAPSEAVAFEAVMADTLPAGPLPSAEASRIFRCVQKVVRQMFLRDGYTGASGDLDKKGGHMFKTSAAPVSPDTAAKAAAVMGPKRKSADETAKAAAAFKVGQTVRYTGGGRAAWLKAGTTLEVKGTVVSRGRTYVRCYAVNVKRKVTLSSSVLAANAEARGGKK